MEWFYVIFLFIMIVLIVMGLITIVQQRDNECFVQTLIEQPIPYTFYWINLDKAVERRNNMQQLFKLHHMNNQRVNAILGYPTQYDKEIACTKSHCKAIKQFYHNGDDIGIICEDDLTMEYKPYWRENLTDVVNNAPLDWECIQLALIGTLSLDPVLPITLDWPFNALKFSKKHYIPYFDWHFSALCYIINRRGAKAIIESKQPPTTCAERYLFKLAKTYVYKYPMFTYPTVNDSQLHPTHLYSHVVSKNVITHALQHVY